ncbi:methyltransferase domain-containing protein [Bradymonas sediminis]|uniref:Uncharacterized protein n=1 Tax=Bradymonas sediminis TaxID=1548548 RepID=A0A2Z4FJZ2_9DELT|nr:methyltransferase domain-containing protein [Bradymonas sediminis]AWV88998.1 hypothetical protein DN745_06445 [Bradymonas sediminis]TDP72012.1 methyltransferase family protein [Bradymonas sediminis]
MRIQRTNDPQDEQLFDGPANRAAQPKTHHDFGPWFHNLHLPDGDQTSPRHPMGDYPASAWAKIRRALPESLEDWSVLNVGCNGGYFCLELAALGARVLGCDRDPHCVHQAQWAAEQFGLSDRIKFRQMHVYEIARSAERYDLVLFMGAFYELRYPALALDIMAERADKTLIFQPFSSISPFKNQNSAPMQLSTLEGLGFEVSSMGQDEIFICQRHPDSSALPQAWDPQCAAEIAAAVGPRYHRIERPARPLKN